MGEPFPGIPEPFDLLSYKITDRVSEYDWLPAFRDVGHLDIEVRFVPQEKVRRIVDFVCSVLRDDGSSGS